MPHDTVDDIYADPSTREGVKQYIYCADGRADMLSRECGASSITRVEVPLVNWPGVETSGIDWELRGEFDAGGGSLAGGFSGTYTLDYDIKALSRDGVPIQGATQSDEEPPLANVEHAYDGMTHNPKGRRLKLILRYRPGGEQGP